MNTIHTAFRIPVSDSNALAEAKKVIQAGGIIIYPTDTVYGLGCDATNKNSVKKIKEIKFRDKDKPLSIIAPSIEWIKKNPQPLNSSLNYLTNCREIALMGVKKSKPTFNSKYDKGIYEFPLQGGKNRFSVK